MNFVYAFIFCGFVCAIGQVILEFTNLTPGHLNTILVVAGAFLSFLGFYECFIELSGAGATVPITNFGHMLYQGAYEGMIESGFTGLIKGLLLKTSGGLSVTIIISFLVAVFFKPKN